MQRILGVWIYAKEIISPALILTCQYSAAQEIGVFNEDHHHFHFFIYINVNGTIPVIINHSILSYATNSFTPNITLTKIIQDFKVNTNFHKRHILKRLANIYFLNF